MKTSIYGFVSILAAAYLWSFACSPPRPREGRRAPPNGSIGGGGATAAPPAPDVDVGLGGGGAGETASICGSGPDATLAFSKRNLLRSAGECAELRYCEFEIFARELAARATEYVDAPTEERKTSLKAAFRESMKSWSRAELFQFGPAASSADDMDNGQGLRDLIYSWPNVSRCRVEEQLFGQSYTEAGFDNLVQVPINSRGLFAVEYLVFYEGSDNVCTQFSVTNENDAWESTSAAELTELKRTYLSAVSSDVAARAVQLHQAWDPEQGDFLADLTSASAYMDQQHALNTVARAMLYVEEEVKDYKVGSPAGVYEDAPLERPEVSFAGGGTELLAANLAGFRDLFQGCGGQGLGFDDWLNEAGHGDLAADILAALEAAEVAVAQFPELAEASVQELIELHATLKQLTDLLKNDLFGQGSPLGLTLPTSVEGDTD